MRVMEVEVFGRGGLTHYVYNLAERLGFHGVDTTIATAAEYELESRVSTLPANVAVAKVFSRSANRLRGRLPYRMLRLIKGVEFFTDAFSVAALARRIAPDIIHVHCTNPILLWLLLCLKPLGIPLVYTAHDVRPHESIPFEDAIYRWIYGLSDHVIVHSERDRERLEREFGITRGVSVIPHGEYTFFDHDESPPDRDRVRQEFGLEPDDEVALFFGFIREYKGLDLLLESWPEVRARRPRARLLVAGDPARLSAERLDEYRAMAEAAGARCAFTYVAFEEVPRWFAAADALVLPYRRISQSGVLLLALSLGLPVIATRVGAFPEVLRDDQTGILIPPEDPVAMVSAIERILGDPVLRERLAENGRTMAHETYSWGAIAARTAELFASLQGGAPEREPVRS